jgi:peptidyl-prolyl cis-trans isomerase SurA
MLVVMMIGLVLSFIVVCAAPAGAEVINKVIATVDGDPITLYELERYEASDIRTLQGGAPAGRKELLETLITDRLIEKEAVEKGVIVKEEDVDRYIADIRTRNKLTEEQLKTALEAQGITLADYRKQIRQEIERQQLITREIRGKVNVTPQEVQRYYDAHLDDYATPERYRIAHIVFAVGPDAADDQKSAARSEADAVYEKIEDGADFAEMAKEYSQDASGKSGGELGWFEPKQLVDSLREAVAGLEVGGVSAPVEGPAGIHILKLLERETASHRELSDLQGEIKDKLYAAALEERFQKWLTEELRKRHDVDIRP